MLQKTKQDHLYIHAYVGRSPICLLGVSYSLKFLETLFVNKSLENFGR